MVTTPQYLSKPASAAKHQATTSDSRPPPMSFSAPSTHSAPGLVASVKDGHGPGSTVHPHCCPQPHCELMLSLLPSGDKWSWDCVTWTWPPSGSLEVATLEVKLYWFCWPLLLLGSTASGHSNPAAESIRYSLDGVPKMGQPPLQMHPRVGLHQKVVPRPTEPGEMTSREH